ncbi:MAG: UDP-N-acetylmuramate dehydrogenase [bacterium]|nr:UDP-N-acetylmuramate dehydrogenase [bacterium]
MIDGYQKIIASLGQDKVKIDEPMKNHTTFKVGGPADLFCEAETEEEIAKAVRLCQKLEVPYFILGGGSNILVSDKGIRGIVIKIINNKMEIKDDKVNVGAGQSLPTLVLKTIDKNLEGLEFAAGIPGTVGGAVVGNAGAWQKDVGDKVARVRVLNPEGEIKWLSREECGFSYRDSRFKTSGEIILEAEFTLATRENGEVKEEIKSNIEKRSGQPQEPSAGCVFVNPKPDSAGRLIDECGLKGTKIGDAEISPDHANFIINIGSAKASDVLALMDLMEQKVFEKFGIKLKREIKVVGEF